MPAPVPAAEARYQNDPEGAYGVVHTFAGAGGGSVKGRHATLAPGDTETFDGFGSPQQDGTGEQESFGGFGVPDPAAASGSY